MSDGAERTILHVDMDAFFVLRPFGLTWDDARRPWSGAVNE